MKNIVLLPALLMLCLFSCTKPENESVVLESRNEIENIYAYSMNEDRGKDVLDVSYSANKDIIYLTTRALPENETPVDISAVIIELTVPATAVCSIESGKPLDFSAAEDNEIEITVTAQNSDVRKYVLKVIVTPPYAVLPQFATEFTEQWSKTGTEMQMKFPRSAKDIAISGDWLLVLDNNIDMALDANYGGEGAKIRVYDKKTGDFVQIVNTYEGGWTNPRSYMWSLAGDSEGHFAMGRLNSGGAGCWVDVYQDKDTYLTSIIKTTEPGAEAANLPNNMGKRMQVLGSLTEGNGMIVMTAGDYFGTTTALGCYATWELKDGATVNVAPAVTSTTYMWNHAVVQRESLEDPTMYIAYTDETGYASHPEEEWDAQHGAHFVMTSPGSAPVEVNTECFEYRINDMEVFHVGEGRFMASLQQNYSTAGQHSVVVYNFTDPEKMASAMPSDTDFNKFRIYRSEEYTVVNDCRYGNIAVDVDESAGCAYIYSFIPASDLKDLSTGEITGTAEARITCTKMTVTRTN